MAFQEGWMHGLRQAPTWVVGGALCANELPAESSEVLTSTRYQTLAALTAETWKADSTSPDGKMRFMINEHGEGWAHVLGDCTRVGGEKALSFGGGNKMDKDQCKEKEDAHFTVLEVKAADDKAQVFYTKASR